MVYIASESGRQPCESNSTQWRHRRLKVSMLDA
jgi:hypothetical protein